MFHLIQKNSIQYKLSPTKPNDCKLMLDIVSITEGQFKIIHSDRKKNLLIPIYFSLKPVQTNFFHSKPTQHVSHWKAKSNQSKQASEWQTDSRQFKLSHANSNIIHCHPKPIHAHSKRISCQKWYWRPIEILS